MAEIDKVSCQSEYPHEFSKYADFEYFHIRTLLPPAVLTVPAPAPPIAPLPRSLMSPVAVAHHLFHDPAPSPTSILDMPPAAGAKAEGESAVTSEITNKPLEDVKVSQTGLVGCSSYDTDLRNMSYSLSPLSSLLLL